MKGHNKLNKSLSLFFKFVSHKQAISRVFQRKYLFPFGISIIAFWLLNKIAYCYDEMKGEPFDRIMGLLNDPFHIADMPIVSFSADHILIPMLIAVMIFILILTRKKKKLRSGEEHGSAKFADKYEILKFMDKDPRQNIILTETEGLSLKPYIDDPVNGRNKNILVIGSPGSWKTRSYVKPNIMQLHSSYVVTDPKGTVLDEVGYLLKKAGYVIIDVPIES